MSGETTLELELVSEGFAQDSFQGPTQREALQESGCHEMLPLGKNTGFLGSVAALPRTALWPWASGYTLHPLVFPPLRCEWSWCFPLGVLQRLSEIIKNKTQRVLFLNIKTLKVLCLMFAVVQY